MLHETHVKKAKSQEDQLGNHYPVTLPRNVAVAAGQKEAGEKDTECLLP